MSAVNLKANIRAELMHPNSQNSETHASTGKLKLTIWDPEGLILADYQEWEILIKGAMYCALPCYKLKPSVKANVEGDDESVLKLHELPIHIWLPQWL